MEEMIDQERLLKEFQHLVSINAESYEEREMADYLIHRLRELGLETEEDDAAVRLAGNPAKGAGNVFGRMKGNGGSTILFSSHMDTVTPGNGKRAVIHEDGRITSAGDTVLGADDAAGIAAILEMLTVIKERDLRHPDIEVLFPAAEEPYAQGSRMFDYNRVSAKMAYVLDLSGAVGGAAIAAPSMISLQIHVRGKSAHAGFCPENGIHAIAIAAKAIASLPYGRVDEETTVNLGTIRGGTARNIVPDEVTVTGEIRSMDHGKALAWVERIREVFQSHARTEGGSAEVSYVEEFRSYRIGEQEAVVQRFLTACDRLNLPVRLEETFGGSDNNHFTAHGIRGIVIACAMNEVHTKQEYTTVEELRKSAELTLQLAVSDCGFKG